MADINDVEMIVDTVNDPIITNSDTPQSCSTRELLDTGRPRIAGKALDGTRYPRLIR